MTRPLALAALAAAAAIAVAGPARAAYPAPVRDAILAALDDEYLAQTTYAEIIRRHGADRPFSNIMRAEQMHESWLAELLSAQGHAVPANPYAAGKKPLPAAPASAAEACAAGVAAERANMRLYDDRLLPAVAAYPEVTAVMQRLRDDSATRHLPAFQRCGGQGAAMGPGAQGRGAQAGGAQGRGAQGGGAQGAGAQRGGAQAGGPGRGQGGGMGRGGRGPGGGQPWPGN